MNNKNKKTHFDSIQYNHNPDSSLSRIELIRRELAFNRASWILLFVFIISLCLIIGIRWDLFADYYRRVGLDWLLITIFLCMGATLIGGANLRKDIYIIVAATIGGLIIESWGTQTEIWRYYTELPPYNDPSRPPWWIIPAWPIASLAINRFYILLDILVNKVNVVVFHYFYWPFFILFNYFLFDFYKHTIQLPFTWAIIAISMYMLFKPGDVRKAVMIFVAGSALGYFLEYWGTTRYCWVYFTGEQPPPITIFAHGAASAGFARVAIRIERHWPQTVEIIKQIFFKPNKKAEIKKP